MAFGIRPAFWVAAIVLAVASVAAGATMLGDTHATTTGDPPLTQVGPATQSPVNEQLFAGWNLKSWKQSGCKPVRTAAGNLVTEGTLNVMWQFINASQSWLGFDPDVPDVVNSLKDLCQGTIVWLHVASATTWTQSP